MDIDEPDTGNNVKDQALAKGNEKKSSRLAGRKITAQAKIDRLEAQGPQRSGHMSKSADDSFHRAQATKVAKTIPKPQSRNLCMRKKCKSSACKIVHPNQAILFADYIATIPEWSKEWDKMASHRLKARAQESFSYQPSACSQTEVVETRAQKSHYIKQALIPCPKP
ncbi:hypothetical protein EK21DRAFT_118060 [Setomelanomma holmii]|uniref:Uncharacterized protein n=1 Tax=Setomelanomma holmii TaxID=210430 RepID=A0A9P4GWS9_9PLEO|nr:hypothetical protein EK21DRAFT_118060 [Setomelanomma holmii]